MTIGRFFAGIFMLVWNPTQERYLILQRSEDRDHAAGVWECVSGRVDQGESFGEALKRESVEELGVEVNFEYIIGSVHFYRGPKTPEYEMVGLACLCSLDEPEKIKISSEHAQYRWVTLAESEKLYAVEGRKMRFIHHLIQRTEGIRTKMPTELQAYFRQVGVEIDL